MELRQESKTEKQDREPRRGKKMSNQDGAFITIFQNSSDQQKKKIISIGLQNSESKHKCERKC